MDEVTFIAIFVFGLIGAAAAITQILEFFEKKKSVSNS
jgi:hypothetical protein